MRFGMLLFLMFAAFPHTVHAEKTDFQSAESLLYARKTSLAVPRLANLCEAGTLRACSLLGFAYNAGRYGLKKDEEQGVSWYEKCAEQEKNFFCHNELGRFYARRGDYDKALIYYKAGAQKGNSEAQYRYGKMILDGKGVHPDAEKALRWLRRAAHSVKKPSKPAQCLLVEMSYYGIGMKPSAKDTAYWLKKCDNPLIRALRSFYGHGVAKERAKAKEILTQFKLTEALGDWKDFTGQGTPSVGKTTVRDQNVPEDCFKQELLFGTGRKNPKIETYAVKIFHPDFYRTFDVRDGYMEKIGGGEQMFEACGTTFYTTIENKRLFNKALKQGAVIKIGVYTNACLGSEIRGVCALNLPWKETEAAE